MKNKCNKNTSIQHERYCDYCREELSNYFKLAKEEIAKRNRTILEASKRVMKSHDKLFKKLAKND